MQRNWNTYTSREQDQLVEKLTKVADALELGNLEAVLDRICEGAYEEGFEDGKEEADDA